MKPVSIALFSIASIALIILFGGKYVDYGISKTAWILITSICTGIFIVKYLADTFFTGNDENNK